MSKQKKPAPRTAFGAPNGNKPMPIKELQQIRDQTVAIRVALFAKLNEVWEDDKGVRKTVAERVVDQLIDIAFNGENSGYKLGAMQLIQKFCGEPKDEPPPHNGLTINLIMPTAKPVTDEAEIIDIT
jgi:hypothetical protein